MLIHRQLEHREERTRPLESLIKQYPSCKRCVCWRLLRCFHLNNDSQILKSDPECVQATVDLAYCYHQTGDALKSFETYQTALKLDKRSLDAILGFGNLLREAKQHAMAVQVYQQALAVSPTCQAAHTSTIAMLLDLNAVEVAAKYYEQNSAHLIPASHVAVGTYVVLCLYRIHRSSYLLSRASSFSPPIPLTYISVFASASISR